MFPILVSLSASSFPSWYKHTEMTAKSQGWLSTHISFAAKSDPVNLFFLEIIRTLYLWSQRSSLPKFVDYLPWASIKRSPHPFFLACPLNTNVLYDSIIDLFYSDWKHNASTSINSLIYWGIHIFLSSQGLSPKPSSSGGYNLPNGKVCTDTEMWTWPKGYDKTELEALNSLVGRV